MQVVKLYPPKAFDELGIEGAFDIPDMSYVVFSSFAIITVQ